MMNRLHSRYARVQVVMHMEARPQVARGICNAIGCSKRVEKHEALRQPIVSRHYHLPCVLTARQTHGTIRTKLCRELR